MSDFDAFVSEIETKRIVPKLSSTTDPLKFFPKGFKPREYQAEAIRRVDRYFKQGASYVVLEAPPGLGKSHLAATFAAQMGSAYICTLTTLLQKQYFDLFGKSLGARVLMGKSKYKCSRVRGTCAEGSLEYTGTDACGYAFKDDGWYGRTEWPCEYRKAKLEAFQSPLMLSNYDAFIYNVGQAHVYSGDSGVSPIRPLMVLDEVHGVENKLMDIVGVTFNKAKFPLVTEPLPTGYDVSTYFAWMKDVLLPKMKEANPFDPKEREKLDRLRRKVKFVLNKQAEDQWIVERGSNSDGSFDPHWFTLKPLTVKAYGNWLWKWGRQVLLMSATVLDAEMLVNSLGLDPAKGDYVQMPCPFPKENRPIHALDWDMTAKNRDASWPMMASRIDELLTLHANEKGLILAPSNAMLTFIQKHLSRRNQSRLILAFGDSRDKKYQEHLLSKSPTVLASSGLWEGADLADSASRFQIIPQIPRPQWSGQIRARGEKDPRWYRHRTWTRLIQGLGRSVRSETDNATTYVFDQDLLLECNRQNGMIPGWVKEAIVKERDPQ